MNKILVIDDEPSIRMLLSRILELEGYEVVKAKDRATALATLREQEVQVVQQLAPAAKITLLTAHGNIPDGVQAIKNGAFDYIVKGDDNRKVIPIVSRAMDAIASGHKQRMARATTPKTHTFDSIVGRSAALGRRHQPGP